MKALKQYLLWLAIVVPTGVAAIYMVVVTIFEAKNASEALELPQSNFMKMAFAIYESMEGAVPAGLIAIVALIVVGEIATRLFSIERCRTVLLVITAAVLVTVFTGTIIVGCFCAKDTFFRGSLKSSVFERAFDKIGMRAQIQSEYRDLQRLISDDDVQVQSVSEMNDSQKSYRVENLLEFLEPIPLEDRRLAVGKLLAFSDYISQYRFVTERAIAALAETTGKDFDTLDEYVQWFETVRDEDEWNPRNRGL